MGRGKIAPSNKEPIETMGRMELMRELAEWRRVGPSLAAVAKVAAREHSHADVEYDSVDERHNCRICRALARLGRVSRASGEGR
jgi:hypothetical protein